MTHPLPFPRRPDPLRFWRRMAPHRTALVDRARGERWSYAQFDAAADRWAGVLRARGIGRGGIVAVLAGNRADVPALFYACGRIGAALLPLNWRLSAAELAPVLADARPDLLIGEARFRARAESADAPWIDLDDDAPSLLASADVSPDDVEMEGDDAALILYTSGSTGRPKGAVLPHRQIFWNAVATTTAWELGPDDVAPVSTPLFHTGGWNVFATPLWQRGGTIVLVDAFDADDFLRMMDEEGCTMALTVPTQLLMLAESPLWGQPLPRLRRFVSGGAPCPSALAARVRGAGYTFREGYGLTECGPNCFAIPDDEAVARPGCVGWPVTYLGMRLDAGDGREADVGEPGELLLRGPQVFSGYLRNPAQTAETFTADGWLRTGDLAMRDADGAYRICGRRKEMYISGGENVFPAEVEAALADCPGVAEAVVVGVPDERWGEVGRAFIVARADSLLAEADVVAFARQRLAGYKVPRAVFIVPEIPRLGSGKPDRRALAVLEPVMAATA
ncbi:class I adenylate-forming enzyme family protein [Longimicrobium sp.]|uniref:class I adenylate-forming enzyme family protein n=1 Tax=Longimicrobium sp. TaxID=2029185 RepID=UPI002E2FF50E|nr:AMP-binding protein [Longimicrobium sp.]HEX6039571.1 AMP-binding protein [Longimicrobium sp.]